MGEIPQGEDPTHSLQVDYSEPMSVAPVGLQMGFDRIGVDSGLGFAYVVVDANGPTTIKVPEQKILHPSGPPNHIYSEQGTHFTANNIK